MKQITQLIGIGMVVLAIGCSTTGVPRGAQVVGGGLDISYSPPGEGTVILVEKRSGKIVATETATMSSFEFHVTDEDDAAVLKALFGTIPTNGNFVLYFAPDSKGE